MKGILMKPDMIQAILDGKKTQTRRVIKPQPIKAVAELKEHSEVKGYWIPYSADRRMVNNNIGNRKNDCGYYARYQLGEVVYLKEAWDTYLPDENIRPVVVYKYDGLSSGFKWRSPLFMPEWAARHFLQITDVKAERVQEITGEDAINEGCSDVGVVPLQTAMLATNTNTIDDCYKALSIACFADLWDTINKPPYNWDSNPYVFSYSFRRVNKDEQC